MNADEADRVVAAARRAGVGDRRPQSFFRPGCGRRAVENGSLGKLVGVDVMQGAEAGEAEKDAVGAHTERAPAGRDPAHPRRIRSTCVASPDQCAMRVVSRLMAAGQLEEVRLIVLGEGGAGVGHDVAAPARS
jgi:hypothetical protein